MTTCTVPQSLPSCFITVLNHAHNLLITNTSNPPVRGIHQASPPPTSTSASVEQTFLFLKIAEVSKILC